MPNAGSLIFVESADIKNRYAKIVCDNALGKVWNIAINGTDSNGIQVFPKFLTIDNYQSGSVVYYSIDNISGSVGPYSKVTLAISSNNYNLMLTLGSGSTTVWFSEQKLPLNDGAKYNVTPVTLSIFFTISGNWTVPETWNNANNKIHAIGSGSTGQNSPGQRGGGGGAYSRNENRTMVVGTVIPYIVAATGSGNDTTFNGAGYLKAQSAAIGVITGGLAVNGVGDFKTNGGNGGPGPSSATLGGGGAGGPNASGLSAVGGQGGAGDGGLGGAGGLVFAANGSNGKIWTRTNDGLQVGPGGGGSCSDGVSANGCNGGNYGAGSGGSDVGAFAGVGSNGIIVIEWTP